jgi:hypothetical protein
MAMLFQAYDVFISNFPAQYQSLISLGLLAVIVIAIFQLIRKSLLWLFLLVLFVPASIPILSKIGQGIIEFLKYIVGRA